MSVEIWYNPNDPKPIKTPYPIGTCGFELAKEGLSEEGVGSGLEI